MNRKLSLILGFGILFLLFVQSITTFIEGIYILELLSTSLDEKVLGLLFLFSPFLLLLFRGHFPRWLMWITFFLLVVGRGAIPYLGTFERMIAAGVATGSALILIPAALAAIPGAKESKQWLIPAQGLALAVGLSILLRTLNYTIDLSLTGGFGWIGWVLAILLGVVLTQLKWDEVRDEPEEINGVTPAGIGILGVLALIYFMFSSPGVIARWTEGNYQLIVLAVSLLSLAWLFGSVYRPAWMGNITPGWLTLWNIFFTTMTTLTILVHTINFPTTPGSQPVVVSSPVWYQQVPLALMLLSFPVIFIDFGIFSGLIARVHPTPRKVAPGFILGVVILILVLFMNIFSNTWGYVEPISPFFRNKFWLAFLLLGGFTTILALIIIREFKWSFEERAQDEKVIVLGVVLAAIFLLTLVSALLTDRYLVPTPAKNSLKVMTYNIQQANDVNGEKSYLEQLALIREVNPDIIGFQESDSTRISMGNNDYIRYFANKLGYHAYYGPKTVTGTYGTAILSKYPLENPRSVFTYSDQDEIGTAEAEITVGDRQFTIINVHPDGSDEAKLVFARTLAARANEKPDVIAIGDYNLRGWEAPYLLIDEYYKNAWMDDYPTGIDDDGLDMSGENRIDHIFISPHLEVRNPVYVLPPESWTDHPVHWAEIAW
jgi:endonuclease/exonuclease/phosphatase family metal-dependent hydrolase